nr:hypothetical protein [Tanacetum cinerariifolium]
MDNYIEENYWLLYGEIVMKRMMRMTLKMMMIMMMVPTPSDYELTNNEKIYDEENIDEEEEDEVTKGLYDDVNVNLGNEDIEMTNVDQADNKIASLIDTTAYHATTILEITSSFTTPTPPPPLFFNPLSQQATPTPTSTASKITTSLPALPDFESVFKFNERVTNLEKDLLEIKQVDQSSSQRQSSYKAAALIFGFELTKILIDKMEKNKSFDKVDYKKEPYDALVKSYNTDKDIFDSYGEVFSLKRSQDDKDKDQDPTAGSDRGTKIRKSIKDAKSSRDSRSKEKKSSSASKEPSNLNKSLPASLPMLRSQIILLKTYACNKIKSSSRETMINNPLTRRLQRLTGSKT